jgi:uncharacterized protein (UPF0218 family)
VSYDPDRSILVRDLLTLLATAKKARESLVIVEQRTRKTIRLIENDATIERLLRSFDDPGQVATDLTAVLDLLEATRLETRRQIVRLAQTEGISLTKLAGFWGISRQRVSRFAHGKR